MCCQAKDHSVILASRLTQGTDAFSLKFIFLAKPKFTCVFFCFIIVF